MPSEHDIANAEYDSTNKAKRVIPLGGFTIPPFDKMAAEYPDTVTEIHTYSKNNIAHTTLTVVYVDAEKNDYLTAEMTTL